MAKMVIDDNSQPIPVLTPDHTTVANAVIGAGSAVLALPASAVIVDIGVSTDCWLLFGTSGATVSSSTGQFCPKGSYIVGVPIGATHIAHIQDSLGGRISVVKQI